MSWVVLVENGALDVRFEIPFTSVYFLITGGCWKAGECASLDRCLNESWILLQNASAIS